MRPALCLMAGNRSVVFSRVQDFSRLKARERAGTTLVVPLDQGRITLQGPGVTLANEPRMWTAYLGI
jgi:hypothetical protein